MRDPRIGFREEDRPRLTTEECRLQFAREAFLSAVRAGAPMDFKTWTQAEWSAEKAFPR